MYVNKAVKPAMKYRAFNPLLKKAGELTPRHMQIFKKNDFFNGVSIPEVDTRETLESRLPVNISEEELDFLKKCLDKDPEKRYTCEQLLHHRYFDGFNKSEIDNDLLSARRREKLKSGHYQMLLPQLSNNSLGSSTDMRSSHARSMKKYDPLPNI
ncbi:cyclin-dependent kinase-like 4 [Trichonephila inaurata madagascariensis]|uniref:Cyclin-dependent kinase-like 4 n=1 Tax=Trichonephila inaurata madagascariensis TaxID=2747483 RepID=A0A8X6X0Z7_9ARAC|nr:cyclin-dependent kinase-like 4 [Trichonephila inaurata madagascariensis]